MLRAFHSNRIETLAARLGSELAVPLADPLVADTVVVQNPGMAQWLTQRLALAHGVCANIEFPLPANFIWRLFEGQLAAVPADNPYHQAVLTWRCMALLPELAAADPAFAPVAAYLADDPDQRKLYRLSQRVAGLFDQYLVYRPEWLREWDEGGGDHWQARLWRRLCPAGAPPHRATLLEAFLEVCRRGQLEPSRLPPRVAVFGLSAVAPAYLAVLAAVSERVPVDLYVLGPSAAYWGDIVPERDLARRRDQWRRLGQPDLSRYFEVGHPLLAALGTQGQELLEQLQDHGCLEEELFEDPGDGCRLHRLQQDILLLRDRRGSAAGAGGADDGSIQVHGCHSPLREVQVLQDRLLALFETLPHLTPRDIVVMAPDIGLFAPHVEAVFGSAPGGRFIPFSLADRGAAEEDPHLQGLLGLLALPVSRLEASYVLGLLDLPALRRRFGLAAQDLPELHQWIESSGIRWGLDGADRAAAGLPAAEGNSWRFGLRRLLMGYALPDTAGVTHGILPVAGIEGAAAARVGALAALVETLERWRRRLAVAATAAAWRQRVGALLEECFAPTGEEATAFQVLRAVLDDLAREEELAGGAPPLSPEVFRDLVGERLAAADAGQGFLAGQVTFCNMVPMRSIPFRVVCLLGMNDLEFPRLQRPLSFDLMARQRRRGDRSRRDDDRYLFLEALLGARDVLYISYQGRDVRDNSERVPSVVVSDLVDYIARAEADGAPGLVTEHPLQPFSRRYFEAAGPRPGHWFSYADQWLPGSPADVFAAAPLPAPGSEWRAVELALLLEFFANPARFLLRRRLGVQLIERAAGVEDSEPFQLDGLQTYLLRQRLLAEGAADDVAAVSAQLVAMGSAPHGPFAGLAATAVVAPLAPLASALEAVGAAPEEDLELDLAVGGCRLIGWLPAVRPDGLVRHRAAKVKARDRIALWLEHLALCALAPAGVAPRSRLLTLDGEIALAPVEDPLPLLGELLALYWQGLSAPLPFFCETSWAYAEVVARGKDREAALKAAWARWLDGWAHSGEGGDVDIATAWGGVPDPLGEPFEALALRVYRPLLEHLA